MPSALDDGTYKAPKKQKQKQSNQDGKAAPVANPPKVTADGGKSAATGLQILPGEKLKDFAARVDQSMPVSGLASKGKRMSALLKLSGGKSENLTRHNKRLQKMIAAWRVEDQKRKEKEEVLRDEAEGEVVEDDEDYKGQFTDPTGDGDGNSNSNSTKKKKKKTGKKKGTAGDDSDEDPFADLARKRREAAPSAESSTGGVTGAGLTGLHDVVLAPPQLRKVKEKFKVRNGALVDVGDVPGSSGSLKRREELSEARRKTLEVYRKMMEGKGSK